MTQVSEAKQSIVDVAIGHSIIEIPTAQQSLGQGPSAGARIRRALGTIGAAAALAIFLWLPLGWLNIVPSMIEVFGIAGLRIPASVTVGGLLLAAIGFNDF